MYHVLQLPAVINLARSSEGEEVPLFQNFRSTNTSWKFFECLGKVDKCLEALVVNMWFCMHGKATFTKVNQLRYDSFSHSALLITFKKKTYIKLTDNKCNTLRAKLQSLQVVIIDEISMVGNKITTNISKHFHQITCNSKPFRGLSVLHFETSIS